MHDGYLFVFDIVYAANMVSVAIEQGCLGSGQGGANSHHLADVCFTEEVAIP